MPRPNPGSPLLLDHADSAHRLPTVAGRSKKKKNHTRLISFLELLEPITTKLVS